MIERLCPENACYLPLKPEPFEVIGRAIPVYDGEKWSVGERLNEVIGLKTYPDDPFDPADYIGRRDRAAFLAMDAGRCAGSVRIAARWNGDAVIEDIAVTRDLRHRGIGTSLLDAAFLWAREQGFSRVMAETQDNNLFAVRFYLKYGFSPGGIDTRLYTGAYEGETALFFYAEV